MISFQSCPRHRILEAALSAHDDHNFVMQVDKCEPSFKSISSHVGQFLILYLLLFINSSTQNLIYTMLLIKPLTSHKVSTLA